MEPRKQSETVQLTSLRFLAALYVICFHTADQIFDRARDLSTEHGRVLDMGFTAVSFFFVLSGYVLTLAYVDRSTPMRTFYVARFTRIYPLFFLTLLIDTPDYFATLAAHAGIGKAITTTGIKLAANIIMIQSWIPHLRAMDGPNWSLSVEAFLYLLFPFLLTRLKRLPLRGLAITGVSVYLTGLIAVVILIRVHLSLSVVRFSPLLHVPSFVTGIICALLFQRIPNPARYRRILLMSTATSFVAIIVLYEHIPMALLNDGLLAPAYASLIFAITSDSKFISATLCRPWLVLCGHASYGMYLLHMPLWHIVGRLGVTRYPGFYPAYVLLVIASGILSLKYIETPIRKRLHHLLSVPQQRRSNRSEKNTRDAQPVLTATLE
jgi:peptidoglycan/LPS O-acetylase OafA/YrhL